MEKEQILYLIFSKRILKERGVLDRTVALYIMHEILVAFDNSDVAGNMHMTYDARFSKFPEDLVIRIRHYLNDNHLKIIVPIVEKRNLKLIKLEDAFVIL